MNFGLRDLDHNVIIAILVTIISVRLYITHRTKKYNGVFNVNSNYKNISPLKHDMTKQFTTDLFPLLVYGLTSEGPFLDTNNIMESKLIKMLIGSFAYFIYYELVQPYVVTKLPDF